MRYNKNYEDLEKIPLEVVIEQLERDKKELRLEAGKREAYVLELEETLEKQNRRLRKLNKQLDEATEELATINRKLKILQGQKIKDLFEENESITVH